MLGDGVRAFSWACRCPSKGVIEQCRRVLWRGLARAHLEQVRTKITALRVMETVLQRISDDCTDKTRCRLLELFSHTD
jgi:hypothetical protein